MSSSDLSEAIVVYLRRYPSSNEADFRARFTDADYRAVRALLTETMRIEIAWEGKSLIDIGREVRAVLCRRHSVLSDAALAKLGNYFTYQVK